MQKFLLPLGFLAFLSSFVRGSLLPFNDDEGSKQPAPTVQINNGSISGLYLKNYQQELFLGIPFAAPPIGNLRFANPQPYNQSWGSEIKNFTTYGNACFATSGSDSAPLPQSEDCLSLNVVKPRGFENESLPVGIWIHGGGWADGSSAREAYNLSFIVRNGVNIGKPFIGVSINYRLSGFGWLSSKEVARKGWTNVGLRDQLQAIEWVHENIEAFGGDSEHLVIWGESAGGISVGNLLTSGSLGSYVKGAIMESGTNPATSTGLIGNDVAQADYNTVVEYFNCTDAKDTLECLQKVNALDLVNVFNTTNGIINTGFQSPQVDGKIIPDYPSKLLKEGKYSKVPILFGTNTDEGSSFADSTLNSTEAFKDAIRQEFPYIHDASVERINELYEFGNSKFSVPLDPTYNSTPITYPDTVGLQYPRIACFLGDAIFIGMTRIAAQIHSKNGIPVYKYRHNIPDQALSNAAYLGSAHFQEVVYVFDNNLHPANSSYGSVWFPHENSPKIAKTISKFWASFISDLNPNYELQDEDYPAPEWPVYKDEATNMVFDLNGLYVEEDNARKEAVNFLGDILPELQA